MKKHDKYTLVFNLVVVGVGLFFTLFFGIAKQIEFKFLFGVIASICFLIVVAEMVEILQAPKKEKEAKEFVEQIFGKLDFESFDFSNGIDETNKHNNK